MIARALEAQGCTGDDVALRARLRRWFDAATLASHGVRAASGETPAGKAAFVELVTPGEDSEYWLGYQNFYVITRYNRSSFYAMSVFQLGEAVKAARTAALASRK